MLAHKSTHLFLLLQVFMALNENMLTGEVPEQLGDIESLESLKLGGNSLTGDLPESICSLDDLETLSVDCKEVECSCCTECVQDATPTPTAAPSTPIPTATPTTSAPTERSTPSPTTPSPTASPTVCVNSIETTTDCFNQGEEIVVNFRNCNPRDDDWIGVYPDWANSENLGTALLWSWA